MMNRCSWQLLGHRTVLFPNRGSRNKRSPSYAAVNSAHGMTEGQRRKINKESGPKKNIISVKEREQEVLNSVPAVYRESLEKVIQKYRDVFPEKLPKGAPPNREVQHRIEIEPGSDPPYRPPYRLGPAEQDELEEQIKGSPGSGFYPSILQSVRGTDSFCAQERRQMADVH